LSGFPESLVLREFQRLNKSALNNEHEIMIVNGAYQNAVINSLGQSFILQKSYDDSGSEHTLRRLNSTLAIKIGDSLLIDGLDHSLSLLFQVYQLRETALNLDLNNNNVRFVSGRHERNTVLDETADSFSEETVDFAGALGIYFRELFFHIPCLIANHLNSQCRYDDAQKWYHYVFEPGICQKEWEKSLESVDVLNSEFCWRYIEFRQAKIETLREILTDGQAIAIYKENPFAPHAIARLRLSAYQKSIAMKYIDNLLDWGDQLFTQDTMESINEATLLYIMAADILGERPAELGECGSSQSPQYKTYKNLRHQIEKGSEFLIEMEQFVVDTPINIRRTKTPLTFHYLLDNSWMTSINQPSLNFSTLTSPQFIRPRSMSGGSNDIESINSEALSSSFDETILSNWLSNAEINGLPEDVESLSNTTAKGRAIAAILYKSYLTKGG
jgi:hypothetical protein